MPGTSTIGRCGTQLDGVSPQDNGAPTTEVKVTGAEASPVTGSTVDARTPAGGPFAARSVSVNCAATLDESALAPATAVDSVKGVRRLVRELELVAESVVRSLASLIVSADTAAVARLERSEATGAGSAGLTESPACVVFDPERVLSPAGSWSAGSASISIAAMPANSLLLFPALAAESLISLSGFWHGI